MRFEIVYIHETFNCLLIVVINLRFYKAFEVKQQELAWNDTSVEVRYGTIRQNQFVKIWTHAKGSSRQVKNAQKASAPIEAAIESFDLGYVGLKRSGGGEDPSTNETNETKEKQNKSEETATVSEEEPSESSDKVTVLPKLQYWRVVSNECCGAGGM